MKKSTYVKAVLGNIWFFFVGKAINTKNKAVSKITSILKKEKP